MYKMEVEKIDLIIEKLEKLAYSLNGKKYDFTKYFVGNNLIDEFIFKLDNFEFEKNKQDKMKEIVKEVISDDIKKYFEEEISKNNQCFDDRFEEVVRVEDFGGYYILWLYGIPSFNINFVFDKSGKLLFDNRNILGIDKDNFFVFDYNVKEMCDKLYHYEIKDSKVNLVNVIENVIDVDNCEFFNNNLVVCCGNDDRMIYNYKTKQILIPSYSGMYSDIGKFEEFVQNDDNYIRIVKNLYGIDDYKSVLISSLEFLVDRDGRINSGIFDFENKYNFGSYLVSRLGNNQEEILNSVYEDVSKACKLYKRVKKQN